MKNVGMKWKIILLILLVKNAAMSFQIISEIHHFSLRPILSVSLRFNPLSTVEFFSQDREVA